ncbi:MAG TPA: hypothetical protein VFL65_00855 [Jatrophihabitans sp.]|nr:hypothetical protein [Jatrophihabitans sp.]
MSNDTEPTAEPDVAAVEWRGRTFTFPADVEDWPAEAVEAFEQDKAMTAVHAVLGDKQWQAVRRVSGGTVREVVELFELLAKAAGFDDAGE